MNTDAKIGIGESLTPPAPNDPGIGAGTVQALLDGESVGFGLRGLADSSSYNRAVTLGVPRHGDGAIAVDAAAGY